MAIFATRQVGCDELMGGFAVSMLAPAFGEHVLLMRFEHGEATNLVEIARKAPFVGEHRKRCSHINSSFGSLFPRGKPEAAPSMADRPA
jgi:hypothetical protein